MYKSKKPNSPRTSITSGEAARHCQVTLPTIQRWIRDGALHAVRTRGGHARIARDEFARFLRECGMPPLQGAGTTAQILVVDDQPDVVDLLVELLARHPRGFKLETATDGYEALVKVGSFKPSLLILDVMMPLLDGIKVCRRLKADPATRSIKILGVTGYPDSIPTLIEAGADACLEKPLDPASVVREVERLLRPADA